MGFFDGLKALLDTKKWYTEDNLKIYFKHEIDGTYNTYIGKNAVTTNISKVVSESIKKQHPQMNSWAIENEYCSLTTCNEGVYKIEYKGRIVRIKSIYGDSLDSMHYDITVYTNKYAEMVSNETMKSTVKVW